MWKPEEAFTLMFAISMFGAVFTWFMIFITHIGFRRSLSASGDELAYRIPGSRIGAAIGAIMMIAIAGSTAFTNEFRATLPFGLLCLFVTAGAYLFVRRSRVKRSGREASGVPPTG